MYNACDHQNNFNMPIYSLGSNGSGQLGISHEEDVSHPTLITILPPELRHTVVRSVCAGGNHTLLLTCSGDVYFTGDNTNGRCASRIQTGTTFCKSDLPAIKLCAATWEASIFVSDRSNSVSVCGTGAKGELGLGPSTTSATTPALVPNFPPADTHIVDLAACMGHVVFVLSNGEVWGWGNGQQGQLGEPSQVVWQPRKIEGLPFNGVRAVCGKDFTVIFGHPDHGNLAIFGVRKRDRFGIKHNAPPHVQGWKDVQATWGGIYVLMNHGSLLGWGRDDHGQLPPQDLPNLHSFAAGSEHVLALTTSGKVLAWGWGEHGNCGESVDDQKDVKGRWNELEIEDEPVKIAGGCATSWIMTSCSET